MMRGIIAAAALLLAGSALAQGTIGNSGISGGLPSGAVPTVVATGGNTARTLADRANDPGYSVLEKHAACDGVTDDTTAINAALSSGNTRVTIPAGQKCYSATGVTVPPGVTLAGMSFAPGNPPSGSEILCAANIAACVTAGNGTLAPVRIEHLVIATNASSAPTAGSCLYFNGGQNVSTFEVATYNCFDGRYYKSNGYNGIGSREAYPYSGKIADAHIVMDTWPELYINGGRLGMNGAGDLAASAFIRITGGVGGTSAGPNTLNVSATQFNQSGTAAVNWLQFTNCGGTCLGGASPVNAAGFVFDGIYVENISGAFITSDSTWNDLYTFSIEGSGFSQSNVPFFSLNAATGLEKDTIVGSNIVASTFALAPGSAANIDQTTISANAIQAATSLTSANSNANLSFGNNSIGGTLGLSGPWQNLSAFGDHVSGIMTNAATGQVIFDSGMNVPLNGFTSCGSGPGVSTGSNALRGTITTGTGSITSCQLNFSGANGTPFGQAPTCTVSSPLGSAFTGYTVTAASLLITTSAAGGKFSYQCTP